MADLHISVDIEADGPIPGPYSMSSVGMVAVSTFDGAAFVRLDLENPAHRFYRELAPISEQFVPEAAAVSGLDRDTLIREGADPREAMTACSSWVRQVSDLYGARPVFVGYPLGFDWLWVYHYLIAFTGGSPFGHSGHLDIKTMYAQKAGVVLGKATKRAMPRRLMSGHRHTHNAMDDAIEQGGLFCNIWQWDGIS